MTEREIVYDWVFIVNIVLLDRLNFSLKHFFQQRIFIFNESVLHLLIFMVIIRIEELCKIFSSDCYILQIGQYQNLIDAIGSLSNWLQTLASTNY